MNVNSRLHAQMNHRESESGFLPLPSPSSSQSSFSTSSSSTLSSFSSSSSLSSLSFSKDKLNNSRFLWLTLYFSFNLGLTLYNKLVLVRFPFPYTLTAVHALFGTIGGHVLRWAGVYNVPSRPTPGSDRSWRGRSRKEMTVLLAFSMLYSVNIAISNLSLQLVTVPFHQVVRAATPIFVIVLSFLCLGKSSSRAKIISLVPVVLGVALATYGDYYFTSWGLVLTLFGTVLAALKTIFTNVLQSPIPKPDLDSDDEAEHGMITKEKTHLLPMPSPTRYSFSSSILPSSLSFSLPFSSTQTANLNSHLKSLRKTIATARLHLHPLDLLYLLSPLAFVQCLFLAKISGEIDAILASFSMPITGHGGAMPGLDPFKTLLALSLNGLIAFGLNVVSFSANKKVGALGITVAANIKQVLTILFAVSLFDLRVTTINLVGILLTLVGGAWFARVEWVERQGRR